MRRLLPLVLLLLSGCSHVVGYAGAHPGYVRCSGKGSITGSGQTSLTAGLGGSGQNSFSIVVDCGSGIEIEQGPAKPADVALPPK